MGKVNRRSVRKVKAHQAVGRFFSCKRKGKELIVVNGHENSFFLEGVKIRLFVTDHGSCPLS
jgi:hypothetical protein